jgi:hypothetical protein
VNAARGIHFERSDVDAELRISFPCDQGASTPSIDFAGRHDHAGRDGHQPEHHRLMRFSEDRLTEFTAGQGVQRRVHV